MHAEAFAFLSTVVGWLGDTEGLRVLEYGVHDVNGSPRRLFPRAAEYVGVDPWGGPGVDVMGRAQDYDGGGRFDVVITAEAMEHDPDAAGQIAAAWRALRPGGKLLITAASTGRAPHRCDGTPGELNGEHYANIPAGELADWLEGWTEKMVQYDPAHGDVYAWAVKP